MKTLHRMWLLAFAVMISGTQVAAQETKPKALVITAENLMAGDARHQELPDSTALLPGDVVHFRLLFTNVNEFPVQRVEFKDPIPTGLRYVASSAKVDRADILVEYSIDGGETFSAQPMIEVIEDGRPVMRPAPAERYTHIRWLVQGWVQPGAQVTAEFQAKLPDAQQPPAPERTQ